MTYADHILVGVNGSRGSSAAIRFAAREAVRRDVGLRLVHVLPDYLPMAQAYPSFYGLTSEAVEQVGRKILDAAAREARQYVACDRIGTALLSGDRVAALVAQSRRAVLVVLGDATRQDDNGAPISEIVERAADACLAPIVAVAPTWSASLEQRVVLVGLRTASDAGPLIEAGLATARLRRSQLVLAHGWELPGIDDDAIARRMDRELWMEEERQAIVEAAAGPRDTYCDVDVEIRVVPGSPARVLQRMSTEADLLILARGTHSSPVGQLGSTGRSLLRSAACPVQILPAVPEMGGDEVAAADVPAPRRDEGVPGSYERATGSVGGSQRPAGRVPRPWPHGERAHGHGERHGVGAQRP